MKPEKYIEKITLSVVVMTTDTAIVSRESKGRFSRFI